MKIKNPLNKRLPRELKGEFGKYVVIFLFFVASISLVSGFLISCESLKVAYDDSFEKYNIEDGNFEYAEPATDEAIENIEKEGVTVYENYYKQEETKDFDSKLRIFKNREEVDKVSLLDGDVPEKKDEIAIDRLYAKNHKLEIGDTLKTEAGDFKICGIVALSDYSTLYENPSDMMFDNDKFGVGVVTSETFDALRNNHIHYSYSWIYDDKPSTDKEAKDKSDDLMKVLAVNGVMENYIPEYTNQAIIFAGDDMGGDRLMIIAFLYIVVVILAFVFAITINNTIIKEANVIGTLRATGYSRGSMVRHYMVVPMLVLLAAAIVGNILGYTAFEEIFADQYLASYSLPAYTILINPEAFLETTIAPMIILFVILLVSLTVKLRISPLKFIRRDLGKKKKKKAFRLNTKIPIMTRFRLRVIFQNIPNYIIIFIGLFFANFILLFGFVFAPMLEKFEDNTISSMFCDYQYILKAPVETETEGAEKFAITSLDTIPGKLKSEEVSVYGVEEDSKYIKVDAGKKEIMISSAMHKKFDIDEGDTLTLKNKYEDKEYKFKVGGIYDYPATIAIFMNNEYYTEVFDLDDGYYNGYLSDNEITDIDDNYIATKITQDDLTKTSRQLIRSMGSMMTIYLVFGVVMFMLIIYLLAKIIIERNSQSISMTKILGYSNKEIKQLYIRSTTIVTLLSLVITIPLCNAIMKYVCIAIFSEYPGWFEYYMPPVTFVKMIVLGVASYAVVALMLFRKVKKVPLDEALKNAE